MKIVTSLISLFFSFTLLFSQNDGALDNSFGGGGKVLFNLGYRPFVTGLGVLSDSTIVVLLKTSNLAADTSYHKLIGFDHNGKIIETFRNSGLDDVEPWIKGVPNNYLDYQLHILPNDKILVSGTYYGPPTKIRRGYLGRFNPNGTPDSSFANKGYFKLDTTAVKTTSLSVKRILDDGKIIVSINDGYEFYWQRLNSDGSIDNSYGVNGKYKLPNLPNGFQSVKWPIFLDDDKVLYLAIKTGSRVYKNIIRLNSDYTLDKSYGKDGIRQLNVTDNWEPIKMERFKNGRVYILGDDWDTTSTNNRGVLVMRLTEDGDLDQDFGLNGGIHFNHKDRDLPKDMVIQPDTKPIICGISEEIGTVYENIGIYRVTTDGRRDPLFATNCCAAYFKSLNSRVGSRIALQPDGKILIAGIYGQALQDYGLLMRVESGLKPGINEEHALNSINLFPNPSTGKINVHFDVSINGILEIFSSDGTRVVEREFHAVTEIQLDLPGNINDGLLFLRIKTNDGMVSRRFILDRF